MAPPQITWGCFQRPDPRGGRMRLRVNSSAVCGQDMPAARAWLSANGSPPRFVADAPAGE